MVDDERKKGPKIMVDNERKKGLELMVKLISIKQFAKELNKPLNTIKTWRRRGILPDYLFKTIGVEVFVRTERIQEWVESN